YLDAARRHGIEPWQVRAVGTSGCRRAMNAETWVNRIQRTMGLKIRIITGEEEARLTWLGAVRDLDLPDGPRIAVDLGGGSTELVLGDRRIVSRHVSLEIGSVRLTEEFLGTDTMDPAAVVRLRKWVEVQVGRFNFEPHPRTVIGVAGTVTTLAAMVLGLQTYDAEQVHGSQLTRANLRRLIDQLLPAGPEERRRMVPTAPERADFLLAGSIVLDQVLEGSRRQAMTVSDRGLRYGLLAL
ncbi:MAG: exopolyphosphatase, partial [Deltaproteobacteria bacterium]|nr:exopolyphosphatase [Deltaproteobacteria bacterium]